MPSNSAFPTEKWRLYIFENDKEECVLNIFNRQSNLLGRKKKLANIFLEHISSSNEHAVIQYRSVHVHKKTKDGVLDMEHV